MTAITAEHERSAVAAVPKGLFLGGVWKDADRGFTVDDPSTAAPIAEVADATPSDALAALDLCARNQDSFAAVPSRQRAEILRRAFELMMERIDDLALVMTLEMGKPLAESKAEVAYAAEFFRWFAEEACRVEGTFATAPNGGARVLTMRQPVGPCLLITPWNFPLAMGTRKIGPAIAAGCTMIVKPAKLTPLSMMSLAGILAEAGLPEGVLSVLPSSSASALTKPLFADRRLRKVSFTGSTEVGQLLLRQAADNVLKTSMELGGNAPFIVFDDADLDKAVEGAMIAKMRNGGEACTAANRFFVQAGVADEFARRLAERMGAMTVGRGVDEGVTCGPLVDHETRAKVDELVQEATSRGATVLTGGSSGAGPGYFYKPTVLIDVAADASCVNEEIFGPVAPIRTFTDEAAMIVEANNSEYGLAAYMFTQDLNRALRVAERLETGMLGVNQGLVSNPAAPFGGVKHSGLGREGGSVGIDDYLETKYLAINASW
jgi:succinate-semialdehyde dehydrogenase / glutarate-semialdehyde dehydrogenase